MLFNPLIEQAVELSAQWHDRTYRKSRWREAAFEVPPEEVLGVPVAAHVTTVAFTVLRAGWDDAVVAAALLHDVLEDANRYGDAMDTATLQALVGDEVTALVEAVTERKYDAAGRPRSWRDRKEEYVAHLRHAPAGAVAVSLADKLHNLWSINEALSAGLDVFTKAEGRRALSAGPREQLWFHEAVLQAAEHHSDERLIPMRRRLDDEIARFARLTRQD